jgi:tRNA (mo5U34)-methyltransferase
MNIDGQAQASADIERLREEMNGFTWWHTIDLGNGLVTPGKLPIDRIQRKMDAVFRPIDLAGKSVLDIGAWNGAYSIGAMRRGASKVTAVDYVTWRDAKFRGRETFDFAVRASKLEIDAVERDIAVPNALADLGPFDVVLFLGVFYHLLNPISVLEQIGHLAKECVVVDTHITPEPKTPPMMVFFAEKERGGKGEAAHTGWAPNPACVEGLLRNVGFSRVTTKLLGKDRGLFHGWK